jgi:hypothetical protein
MSDLVNRVLAAYRPLYLRGLLMDGQYQLPKPQKTPPPSGGKVIHLTPAFDPGRRRVLVATAAAAAVSLSARTTLSTVEDPATKRADEPHVRASK